VHGKQRLKAFLGHARSANPAKTDRAAALLAHGAHESRAKLITGRFAGNQEDVA
jgi:hypothetical protein